MIRASPSAASGNCTSPTAASPKIAAPPRCDGCCETVKTWAYAFRLAARELRGGLGGFRFFLACLVLGVGAIAAIGSLGASVTTAIRQDAHTLFGGDVGVRLVHRPATEAERQYLNGSGAVAEIALLS